MLFKIIYTLYLVVCLFYSVFPVLGPITLRHILTFLMLILCLVKGRIRIDKSLKLYLVFLLFFLISSLLTGYGVQCLRNFVGTYLAAFVVYWSSIVMIKEYQASRWIINTIIIIAIINAFIAVGQFYGNPVALLAPQILRIDLGEEMMEYYQIHSDFHGRYVGGLFDIVTAGYYFSAASIFALFSNKKRITILNWAVYALILFALFLVQERAGLVFGLMCSLIYFIMISSSKRSTLFTFMIFAIAAIIFATRYGENLVSVSDMRYANVDIQGERVDLIKNSWDFFVEHPIGAYLKWVDGDQTQAHNIFMNALLYGGIFGGLLAIYIIIYQSVVSLRFIYGYYIKRHNSHLLLVFCLAYLDYTLNSVFHNPSLLSGLPMFFVLWGGLIGLMEIEDSKKKSNYIVTDF